MHKLVPAAQLGFIAGFWGLGAAHKPLHVPRAASQQGWYRPPVCWVPCSILVPVLPGLLCIKEMLWGALSGKTQRLAPHRLSEQLADPWSPPQGLEEQKVLWGPP